MKCAFCCISVNEIYFLVCINISNAKRALFLGAVCLNFDCSKIL